MKAWAPDFALRTLVAVPAVAARPRHSAPAGAWPGVAGPLVLSVAAVAALVFAPAVVGFGAAVLAACLWTRWLDGHPGAAFMRPAADASSSRATAVGHRALTDDRSDRRVLVCLTPARPANLEIQAGAVLAERLRGSLMVAHVKVAAESEPHARPSDDLVFATNASLATAVGAAVVTVEAPDVAEALIALAEREHVTHVLFGYSGDPAKALAPESIIGRFVRGARGIEISIVSQPPAKNS